MRTLRLWLAEFGLSWWLWLAGKHVPDETLLAFRRFVDALPE